MHIQFASLLSYVPWGRWQRLDLDTKKRDMMARSVEYMVALKNNRVLPNMSCSLPQEVAVLCGSMPQFVGFFAKSAMLVPVPGHHPAKPGSLWVPKVIADSMKQEGLGCSVVRALGRTEAVPQSSKSAPRDRPTVNTHRATLRIRDHIDAEPQDILLVDDVITRGRGCPRLRAISRSNLRKNHPKS